MCVCGDDYCALADAGYVYCSGCEDHHRPPVAEIPGELCPIDQWD